MVNYYKAAGFSGAIITDHFFNGNSGCPHNLSWESKVKFFVKPYYEAKLAGDKCDFDVFFGMEYSLNGMDFLLYGLTPEFLAANPDFDKLTLPELSAAVRGEGAYIAHAHPFRKAWWINEPGPSDVEFIDGFEVYNASMPDNTNKKAMDYAKTHNLAMQAGSDAHNAFTSKPSGIAMKKPAENIFDIINAIKSGQVELIT